MDLHCAQGDVDSRPPECNVLSGVLRNRLSPNDWSFTGRMSTILLGSPFCWGFYWQLLQHPYDGMYSDSSSRERVNLSYAAHKALIHFLSSNDFVTCISSMKNSMLIQLISIAVNLLHQDLCFNKLIRTTLFPLNKPLQIANPQLKIMLQLRPKHPLNSINHPPSLQLPVPHLCPLNNILTLPNLHISNLVYPLRIQERRRHRPRRIPIHNPHNPARRLSLRIRRSILSDEEVHVPRSLGLCRLWIHADVESNSGALAEEWREIGWIGVLAVCLLADSRARDKRVPFWPC